MNTCLVGGPWDGRHVQVKRWEKVLCLRDPVKERASYEFKDIPLTEKFEVSIYTLRKITFGDGRGVFYYAIEDWDDYQALSWLVDNYKKLGSELGSNRQ